MGSEPSMKGAFLRRHRRCAHFCNLLHLPVRLYCKAGRLSIGVPARDRAIAHALTSCILVRRWLACCYKRRCRFCVGTLRVCLCETRGDHARECVRLALHIGRAVGGQATGGHSACVHATGGSPVCGHATSGLTTCVPQHPEACHWRAQGAGGRDVFMHEHGDLARLSRAYLARIPQCQMSKGTPVACLHADGSFPCTRAVGCVESAPSACSWHTMPGKFAQPTLGTRKIGAMGMGPRT